MGIPAVRAVSVGTARISGGPETGIEAAAVEAGEGVRVDRLEADAISNGQGEKCVVQIDDGQRRAADEAPAPWALQRVDSRLPPGDGHRPGRNNQARPVQTGRVQRLRQQTPPLETASSDFRLSEASAYSVCLAAFS